MNYEEFKNEFVDALQERLYEGGNEVSIHVNTVEKMNETYEAITITPAGSNIGMNLNLEVFAEAYENGVPFDEIVEQVTHKVEDHLSNMPTFDVQALTDYEQIKWEKHNFRNFRADYSADELEKSFAFEEECLSKGMKISEKEFHAMLKERLSQDIR